MTLVHRSKELIERLNNDGFTARLLGGLGIYHKSPDIARIGLARHYQDIDVVGIGKEAVALSKKLAEYGWEPDRRFNAVHGEHRMLFHHEADDVDLDVFLNTFEMCHVIQLMDRLQIDSLTLTVSDLLLTKLQIVQLNPKDITDTLSLFYHYTVQDSEAGINADYITGLISHDWGLYTTLADNLAKIRTLVPDYIADEGGRRRIVEQVDALLSRMEQRKKSFKWKLRSKIGRKVPWYQLPDEKIL